MSKRLILRLTSHQPSTLRDSDKTLNEVTPNQHPMSSSTPWEERNSFEAERRFKLALAVEDLKPCLSGLQCVWKSVLAPKLHGGAVRSQVRPWNRPGDHPLWDVAFGQLHTLDHEAVPSWGRHSLTRTRSRDTLWPMRC